MRKRTEIRLRADAPAVGLTLGAVAADLNVLPDQLCEWIVAGMLPGPSIMRGHWLFSPTYALSVRCNGIRIPGTYQNALPTYRQRAAMIRAAKPGYVKGRGGRPKGKKDVRPCPYRRKGDQS